MGEILCQGSCRGQRCVALRCAGEWQELGTKTEGRLVSYVQDWNGWWLAVVRDRPAGRLNGELQALPISGLSSPQVGA